MDATSDKRVTDWMHLRRYLFRIVIGGVMMMAAYMIISIYAMHLREQRIATAILSHEGHVEFAYFGPDWVPESVRERLPLLDRIRSVRFTSTRDTKTNLERLKGLTKLEQINLTSTQVGDTDLEHLKELNSLKQLSLAGTQVTDAGLRHLKGVPTGSWNVWVAG